MSGPVQRVRLDKWLWAARFFRTRAKAKAAIEGGKVHCDGQRPRPAKEIAVGDELRIRQGFDERVVIVRELSEQRGKAAQAQQLYEETADSVQRRESETERRRLAREAMRPPEHRPDKRDRRRLAEIKKHGQD